MDAVGIYILYDEYEILSVMMRNLALAQIWVLIGLGAFSYVTRMSCDVHSCVMQVSQRAVSCAEHAFLDSTVECCIQQPDHVHAAPCSAGEGLRHFDLV